MYSSPSSHHRDAEGSHHMKPDFVPKPGAEVLSLLQPQPGERILDVGCGAGDLTAAIAAAGAVPTGIDLSEEIVGRAIQKYPDLHFEVADVCRYRTDAPYDAVFSHASLHWIQDAPAAARSIWLALRKGGRFVAEFAGSGNVARLTSAIELALEEHGYAPAGRNPWYLPTIGEYASLLEHTGFRVTVAQHFDKPSPLPGGTGLQRWLDSFAGHFFPDVTSEDKASIYHAIEAQVKPHLERDGQWMADTSRIRIAAVKGTA
ncbi:trans-aconitate methyltransferase [Paenibacillus mucilaginosus 3016]|uniref:Trans-aconitate methyltransferase n=2 Tax=Paenibacillus mucilaginosus TaxID=61624 RepID=H6NI05_9BACL|nr:methyltransferase domain-containing protein [Paenibacillus mucilaginosus]AFC30776.1 trans-aconitate methyltransferase [Paenibacillus mucilaginosus 3016]WFA19385.1 methyltransferase domain-containing protein [Paenibacillus mucilaginosus]